MANRRAMIENTSPETTTRNSVIADQAAQQESPSTIEVLYQKMGNRWFAFSLVNDEVFVGSISQDEIDRGPATHNISGSA